MTSNATTQPDKVAHCPREDCNPGKPPRPLHAVTGRSPTAVECRRCHNRYDLVQDAGKLIWKEPLRRGRKPTVGGTPIGPMLLGDQRRLAVEAAAAEDGFERAAMIRKLIDWGLQYRSERRVRR